MQASTFAPNRNKDDLRNLAVPVAARLLISDSLKKVRKCLTRAAKSAHKDTEHVHRLRVATRQATEALEVFREFLPMNQRRRVVKKLKKIRDVAARARDLDVFIESHKHADSKSKKLFKSLARKRKKAQKPISAMHETIRGQSPFRKQCKKLLASLKTKQQNGSESFSQWAQSRTQDYCQDFLDHCNFEIDDFKQLHKFRISAKRFRYRLNVVSSAFPDNAFDAVLWRLRSVQDLLGAINDRSVAVGRLEELCRSDKPVPQEILDRELAALQTAKQEFDTFWRPEVVAEFEAAFF